MPDLPQQLNALAQRRTASERANGLLLLLALVLLAAARTPRPTPPPPGAAATESISHFKKLL